jgi:hypothetical protein
MVGQALSAAATSPRVTRRTLLRATSIGAAGLTLAPWLGRVAAADEAPPVAALPDAAWAELAKQLQGRLLRPNDAMYPAAAIINAARYAGTRPAGIAVCTTPADAAACVKWVRANGIPFAVRSGGHSYAGFSTSDGLVIDVSGMRAVAVDPAASTTTIAGGATNADVGDGMTPYGVYFPGGRCLSVGMAGLTLGGGWGFSCRHLGMTCDNLLATEAVTAAGEIVTASETENADLFWAVRGAGHGNFGVHTSFTYRVVAAGDVTVFRLMWTGGDTPALVDALCRLQVHGPRELGLRLAVRSQARMPRTQPAPLDVDVIGLYWGPPEDVIDLLKPVEQVQAAAMRTVEEMPFPAARDFLEDEPRPARTASRPASSAECRPPPPSRRCCKRSSTCQARRRGRRKARSGSTAWAAKSTIWHRTPMRSSIAAST